MFDDRKIKVRVPDEFTSRFLDGKFAYLSENLRLRLSMPLF